MISCFFIACSHDDEELDSADSVAAQKLQNRRMALLRHFAQIAMGATFNNHQLGVGDLLRQDFGGLHVTAGPPFVGILLPTITKVGALIL